MKKNILLAVLLMGTLLLKAQTDKLPKIKLQVYSSGYTKALGIENAGDSRLFIVEKGGRIWICDSTGAKSGEPFINISDRVTYSGGEQGLLGLAFDPNYAVNGFFYVDYIGLNGNTCLSRFKRNVNNPNKAPKASELILLNIAQPFINHNGGCLRFGPDGYLYMALGDGGGAGDTNNTAQNPGSMLGKILRIDVSHSNSSNKYQIPPTNPFIGIAGTLPEIWATGLRNPWRFTFDRLTGDMWIADVGQSKWEEINFQPAGVGGVNYGWSCWEGAHFYKEICNSNSTTVTFPISEYVHGAVAGVCGGSVTGGFVYRGSKCPDMYGKYFYVDYCTGIFRTIYKDHGIWVNRYLATEGNYEYSTFGEDKDGEIYLTSYTTGAIYHLVDSANTSPRFAGSNSLIPNQNEDIVLFPNPNTGDFNVQLMALQKENCTVTITDQLGKQVLSEKKSLTDGFNEWTFSSSDFAKGIYVFQVKTRNGIISKRFSVH